MKEDLSKAPLLDEGSSISLIRNCHLFWL